MLFNIQVKHVSKYGGLITLFILTRVFLGPCCFKACICSFISGCAGSLAAQAFLQLWQAGAALAAGFRLLLVAVASRCGAQPLGAWASVLPTRGLSRRGSRAPAHRLRSCGPRLSCSAARGIFPGQGSDPWLLHWQVDSLPLSHQGSPRNMSFY